jgi:hypothetical protein
MVMIVTITGVTVTVTVASVHRSQQHLRTAATWCRKYEQFLRPRLVCCTAFDAHPKLGSKSSAQPCATPSTDGPQLPVRPREEKLEKSVGTNLSVENTPEQNLHKICEFLNFGTVPGAGTAVMCCAVM